jgi:hypothetical protein
MKQPFFINRRGKLVDTPNKQWPPHNLPYQAIARRALIVSAQKSIIGYDTGIDIDPALLKGK